MSTDPMAVLWDIAEEVSRQYGVLPVWQENRDGHKHVALLFGVKYGLTIHYAGPKGVYVFETGLFARAEDGSRLYVQFGDRTRVPERALEELRSLANLIIG